MQNANADQTDLNCETEFQTTTGKWDCCIDNEVDETNYNGIEVIQEDNARDSCNP